MTHNGNCPGGCLSVNFTFRVNMSNFCTIIKDAWQFGFPNDDDVFNSRMTTLYGNTDFIYIKIHDIKNVHKHCLLEYFYCLLGGYFFFLGFVLLHMVTFTTSCCIPTSTYECQFRETLMQKASNWTIRCKHRMCVQRQFHCHWKTS